MSQRWVVIGARGQLGSDLTALLGADQTVEVTGLSRAELDVTNADAVRQVIADLAPSVVINATAYNAVDAAESDEDAALAVNAHAPRSMARACAETGARFVHVSTDYVFPGDATEPYAEDAPTGPRSAYGRSKAAGERAVLAELPEAYVVRTAWVYGANGANFVKTMARLERERETVSVVNDQQGCPTWSRDLAAGLIELARSNADGGVYHCTNAGTTTWFGFTQAIFEELGADPGRVLPTTTDAFPRPAPRPAYSVLGDARWRAAGLAPMRPWRDALRAAFTEAEQAFRGTPVG